MFSKVDVCSLGMLVDFTVTFHTCRLYTLVSPASWQVVLQRLLNLYKRLSFIFHYTCCPKLSDVSKHWRRLKTRVEVKTTCIWEFCLIWCFPSVLCTWWQLTSIFAGLCLWSWTTGTSLFLTRWGIVAFLKKALSSGVSSGEAAGCREKAGVTTHSHISFYIVLHLGAWAAGLESHESSQRLGFAIGNSTPKWLMLTTNKPVHSTVTGTHEARRAHSWEIHLVRISF